MKTLLSMLFGLTLMSLLFVSCQKEELPAPDPATVNHYSLRAPGSGNDTNAGDGSGTGGGKQNDKGNLKNGIDPDKDEEDDDDDDYVSRSWEKTTEASSSHESNR